MISGIRAEVRLVLPLSKLRPALLQAQWPWLGRAGLEGTREIELPGTMRRLKVVPLEVTALADRIIARVEVHSIAVLRTSQIKGEIAFQSNRSTSTAVFTGSAAAQAFNDRHAEDSRRLAYELASAVLKKIAHDLELDQLAGLSSATPPADQRLDKMARRDITSNGGDR